MLFGLWLPSFGGGDDKHARRHASDSGQHVAEKLHMAGHIDEAQFGARRKRCVGKSEVDGEAAAFLLLEPIRIGSGEGEHERRLAVVDMACRRDNRHELAKSASINIASSAGVTARKSSVVC